ncbi:MAG: hypothetical protein CMJ84_18100 [Planctomycetes bacterium]|nr:hypothetical protein [Planctomycetota bacterium]
MVAVAVIAHVRLRHPDNGNPLFWAAPESVGVVIQAEGSDDVADGSDEAALRGAIATWNGVSDTTVRLVEDNDPAQQERTDWEQFGINLMLFDEDNSSGYFPQGSSAVAITPVWFYSDGRIAGADVLFNGGSYTFSTDGGGFDIQDVATHELGHLLGLDHTGFVGGTMYPYVDPSVILHRSLARDEEHALRAIYSAGSTASISGSVERASDGTPLAGAQVAVRDAAGRTVSANLTDTAGAFLLGGLDGGTYELYADPLDAPVSAANLGASWTIQTDFESTVHGHVTLAPGASVDVGVVIVGDDVAIDLGRNTDRYPLRCVSGQTSDHSVRGAGLVPGSTLSCSDPSLSLVGVTWYSNRVTFGVQVPAQAAPGHLDLVVAGAGGDIDILTGCLEITPPDPAVLFVSPNQGDNGGGFPLTITGSGFRSGARVVLGGIVYEDGVPSGCSVVADTTIELTALPGVGGLSDVVVIDPSGVEGRLENGFEFFDVPSVQSVFPLAGQAEGGTQLVLVGEHFKRRGLAVRIGGIDQGPVEWVSREKLFVTTAGGTPSGPLTIEVQTDDGVGTIVGAFRYAHAADPSVSGVAPGVASAGGGETITIVGADLDDIQAVVFAANLETGLGGFPAPSITVLGPNELSVTTPVAIAGVASVLVQSATGQSGILEAGFSFSEFVPEGGGGCHTVLVDGARPGGSGQGACWLALVLLAVQRTQRLARRRIAIPIE